MAVLHDESGLDYAVQQRLLRVRVGDNKQQNNAGNSQSTPSGWSYSEVIAIDYTLQEMSLGAATGVQRSAQFAERVALDLAGADADNNNNKVWVGAYGLSQQKNGIAATDNEGVDNGCNNRYLLEVPNVELAFTQSECSLLTAVDTVSLRTGPPMQVSGFFDSDSGRKKLTGYGWLIHGWGLPDFEPPAVLIEQAWLQLNKQWAVELKRTKRSSGRGTRITDGSIRPLPFAQVGNALITTAPLQLTDVVDESEHNNGQITVPSVWTLKSTEGALDVVLEAVPGTPSRFNFIDAGWFGLVSVSGSHTGYGFLDYRQLLQDPTN